jgi:hypothetical protein
MGLVCHVYQVGGRAHLEKNLLAATFLLLAAASPVAAHPPIILDFEPISNPHPHSIRDARDAKETARQIWLSQYPTSWAMYRDKWDKAFSVKHKGRLWVLREPGLTISVDEMDGHIAAAREGE